MATDAEILRNAYEKENKPGRIARYAPWAWEAWAVGATHDDIRRLKDQGYEFKKKKRLSVDRNKS
jgi:hypothetical protein